MWRLEVLLPPQMHTIIFPECFSRRDIDFLVITNQRHIINNYAILCKCSFRGHIELLASELQELIQAWRNGNKLQKKQREQRMSETILFKIGSKRNLYDGKVPCPNPWWHRAYLETQCSAFFLPSRKAERWETDGRIRPVNKNCNNTTFMLATSKTNETLFFF